MAALVLDRVAKRFGGYRAVGPVSLEVAAGEVVALVGGAGSGKSALLRLIGGLDEVTAGRVLVDDKDVTHAEPAARGTAFVFQGLALFPHMSVAGNMGVGLRAASRPAAEIERRVGEVAEALGLTDLLGRRPSHLSGAERQRVALGRAAARAPEVMLLDHPFSALDPAARGAMGRELARLLRRLGATAVLATDDVAWATALASTVVVLRDGQVEQAGSPPTLLDDPASRFVAGLVGSPPATFLRGRVADSEGRTALLEGIEAPVALPLRSPLSRGQEVTLSLRPRDLHLDVGAEGATLRVRVENIERLGETTYLHGETPDGTPVVAGVGRGEPTEPGREARLRFDPARALVFARDGVRLR